MDYFKAKLSKFKDTTKEIISTASKSIAESTASIVADAKQSIVGKDDLKNSIMEQKVLMQMYHPTTSSDILANICEQVYHMPFPEESMRQKYGEILKKDYSVNYRIWNVSEFSYDYRCFNDQVCEFVSVGYPNPPLIDIFMVCKEIDAWVSSNPANVAIVHCQKSKSRSALILCCYLYYQGLCDHPAEALLDVCKKIRIPESQVLDACNSVYANYFALLYSSLKLNGHKSLLQKIVVSELPASTWRVDQQQGDDLAKVQIPLRPYLQVFTQNKMIYSSITKADPIPPECTEAGPISFKIGIVLDGDFLIRIRNFVSISVRYPLTRAMVNTTFLMQSPIRLNSKDVDFGENCQPPGHFYIDLYTDKHEEDSVNHSAIVKIRMRERNAASKASLRNDLDGMHDETKFEIGDDSDVDDESASGMSEEKIAELESHIDDMKIDVHIPEIEKDNEKIDVEVDQKLNGGAVIESSIDKVSAKVEDHAAKNSKPKEVQADMDIVKPEETSQPKQQQENIEEKLPLKKKESLTTPNIYPVDLRKQASTEVDEEEDDDEESEEEEAEEDIENYLKKLEKNAHEN